MLRKKISKKYIIIFTTLLYARRCNSKESDWFFLSQYFAIQTVSLETVITRGNACCVHWDTLISTYFLTSLNV